MEEKKVTSRYNFIYSALVENENDFVGLVAYSIYKQEKIEYVKNFEASKGRPPRPDELEDFHAQTQCRISQYKQMAENRVSDFLEDIYKVQSEKLEEEYKDRLISELKNSKTSFLSGVLNSAIGSFITTIAIGLVIVGTLYSQHGLSWLIQQIINAANLAPK